MLTGAILNALPIHPLPIHSPVHVSSDEFASEVLFSDSTGGHLSNLANHSTPPGPQEHVEGGQGFLGVTLAKTHRKFTSKPGA